MTQLQLKNKRVLVFGLGLLGGGVATTNWLLDRGARVTVTDLKDEKQLFASVKRVEDHLKKTARDGEAYAQARSRLTWALGGHSKALIDKASVIIVNPDVSVRNPFVQYAIDSGKTVCNEGSIFYDVWKKKTVGITGTRGKTTTANWAHHLIQGSILAGNSMTRPFLAMTEERAAVAVTELSSFILELFPYARRSPNIAVITNLYRDHLNRHGTIEEYARAKAQIFAHQTSRDWLILNADDEWTGWFLEQCPESTVRYVSLRPLPLDLQGIWYAGGLVWERTGTKEKKVLDIQKFRDTWGMHNVANLLAAALAARCSGIQWADIQKRLSTVPQVPFRQEVIHRDRMLTVINDTTATSPEGGIAAVRRWGGPNCILIAGGTDRELDFSEWAREVSEHITPNNTIFLAGSATDKMKKAMGSARKGIRTYDTLERCWDIALDRARKFVSAVIVFSPAAKSFEIFANEFDRGQQFNALVERDLKRR